MAKLLASEIVLTLSVWSKLFVVRGEGKESPKWRGGISKGRSRGRVTIAADVIDSYAKQSLQSVQAC